MFKSPTVFVNIVLPILLGIGLLYFYQQRLRSAADLGLGEGTSSYFPSVNNSPIHITDPQLTDSMVAGWKARGSRPVYLWQGNSQLHGVNQYKAGQVNCIEFLFNKLNDRHEEVLGASYPNGNMQEFLLSLLYLHHKFPIWGFIQPVFYDDMREDGIRAEMNIPDLLKKVKEDSLYFNNIPSIKSMVSNDSLIAGVKADNFSGIHATAQEQSERWLDKQLENTWGIWKNRPDIRGNLFNDVYKLRNMALGIKANTIRKMIPGRYADNYQAFLNMLKFCKDHQLPLIIYIPPLRNDVSPPYNLTEYNNFKAQVIHDCETSNVICLNLENLVPVQYWGVKQGTSFGGGTEIDFMHFQQGGHQLIADTIYQTIGKLGFK